MICCSGWHPIGQKRTVTFHGRTQEWADFYEYHLFENYLDIHVIRWVTPYSFWNEPKCIEGHEKEAREEIKVLIDERRKGK